MLDSIDGVLDKIRKLLALAQGGNENEAALAAAKAAELIAKYEVDSAQLEVDGGEVRPDPLESLAFDRQRENESWKGYLMVGIERLLGVKVWNDGGRLTIYGRRSKINTFTYTYAYLCAEVQRLADAGYLEATRQRVNPTRVPALRWKPSFRLGCAGRLQQRLIEAAKTNAAQLAASEGALVVLNRKDKEFKLGFKELGVALVKGSRSQSFDADSFERGIKAGNTVDLGNDHKALGVGQARLGPAKE